VKREILTMRFGRLNPAIVLLGLVVIVSTPAMAFASDPDWKAVEQALGKSGQIQPGDVFRIGMPRTDLAWQPGGTGAHRLHRCFGDRGGETGQWTTGQNEFVMEITSSG